MPFTESELRAMLEDNSAEVPSVPDLAAIAETHGKKIRRRRQIATATATAAVLAVGALTLPGLVTSDHAAKTRQVVVAATVSPIQSSPVDVDYSVFESDSSQSVRQAIKKMELLLSKQRTGKGYVQTNIMFQLVGVAGTVAGFETLPPDRKGAVVPGATGQIVMKIRVDRSVKILTGPEVSKTPPLPTEGKIISLLVNSRVPISRYKKAVPEGARMVAFSMPVPFEWTDGDGDRLPTYDYAGLIFEKADRSLIGGPFQGDKTAAPWNKVKTMDELIALAPKLPFPCSTSDPQLQTIIAKYQISPSALIVLNRLLKECALGVKTTDGTSASPAPTP